MVLGELLVVGGLDELVDQLGGQHVAHSEPAEHGLGAQRDEQVALAGARVTDQAQRSSFADPFAGGQGVNDRGFDVGVGVKVEVLQQFLAREAGGFDAPVAASPVPVLAFGHHQLGEEATVGELFAFGGVGGRGELSPDSGQPQGAAGGVDGGVGGLLGQTPMSLSGHVRSSG